MAFFSLKDSPILKGLSRGWQRRVGVPEGNIVDGALSWTGRKAGNVASVANLNHSPIVHGIADGFNGVAADPGLFANVGHKMGTGAASVFEAPGRMRAGMSKFAIGAGLVAAGAYIFSSLRQSQRNKEANEAMDKELQAIKEPGLAPVMTAASMMPPAPVVAPPQLQPEAVLVPEVDPRVKALASQPFELPPASGPVAAAPAPAEPEDTKFRDMVKAQRGGEVGKPQPFVAPTSSLAEAVMSNKDTAAPSLSA